MSKFNFKSQPCTSREQSKRLLELGLKKETADMCWIEEWRWNDEKRESFCTGNYFVRPIDYVWDDNYINHIPAWSLGRLIEMMPLDVISEGEFDNIFTLTKNYPKGYSVEYDGFSYYHKENIYDTIIEGIEHLIKKGYFNKEYLCQEEKK